MFKELLAEKIVTQLQKVQRIPGRINTWRNPWRHIVIKWTKIKNKGKILKEIREKQQIVYKGTLIRLSTDFSAETLQVRRQWHKYV